MFNAIRRKVLLNVFILPSVLLFTISLFLWGEKFQQVSSSPSFLGEEYRGFKLVEYMGVFYGIDPQENPMILREINTRAKHFWVSYHTLRGVKKKIDRYIKENRKYDFPKEMPHI